LIARKDAEKHETWLQRLPESEKNMNQGLKTTKKPDEHKRKANTSIKNPARKDEKNKVTVTLMNNRQKQDNPRKVTYKTNNMGTAQYKRTRGYHHFVDTEDFLGQGQYQKSMLRNQQYNKKKRHVWV